MAHPKKGSSMKAGERSHESCGGKKATKPRTRRPSPKKHNPKS